ncbi:DUF4272 domain-containing protein [Tenacibaculum xiamenense]|uniref:DUF4272 domain-containing protein n=1 Tax=Tenacibaculum xiamenense TaxID=1261553 RepID=UPI0038947623
MTNSIYFFTSFTEPEKLLETLYSFNPTVLESEISIPNLNVKISDGDDYFLAQREGMLNFYSGLINPDYMEVHSKFLMHLASCVKGYQIEFDSEEEITTIINALIDEMYGLIFSPSMAFYTKNWQLIIDSGGSCELSEYDVKMSAQTFDAGIQSDPESERRKKATIDLLQQRGIPTLESLPVTPSSSQIKYRTEEEVANRIITLAAVAVKGELKKSDISFQVLEKYGVHPDNVSPWELHFLRNTELEEQDYVNAIWRYESLYVLMWATGYTDELLFPSQIVDVASLIEPIREFRDFEEFLLNYNLRDINEILDQLDLTYRLHWACVNARVKNEPTPSNINTSVVYERHYALNWLIDRYGEDWDNVSTST